MSEMRALLKDLVAEILREDIAGAGSAAPRAMPEPAPRVAGGLLTERMVKAHAHSGGTTLQLGPSVVITPLAREAAGFMGVTLEKQDRS